MKPRTRALLLAVATAALAVPAFTGTASARPPAATTYEVTITNLTDGQPFTPPVVAVHRGKNAVFRVGGRASFGVKEIAENGNNAPLLFELAWDRRVTESLQAGDGPLAPPGTPGESMGFDDAVTFTVERERGSRRLSVVSMLICTNDGFSGVNGVRLPRRVGDSDTVLAAGYDAGTEVNTEDFANIVPPCQGLIGVSSGEPGTGTSDPALFEGGRIAHHPNIQGGADLVPGVHGWTDPVLEISITAVS
ncbi:MAG: spondin domain-containing protein [Acidimicrobiia bacterium]